MTILILAPLKIAALMAIRATFCDANTAYGATVDGTLSDNAIARNYGRGWDCAKGFWRQGNQCITVGRPKHSYFAGSSFGSGWDCRHGYYVDGDRCAAIKTIGLWSGPIFFAASDASSPRAIASRCSNGPRLKNMV